MRTGKMDFKKAKGVLFFAYEIVWAERRIFWGRKALLGLSLYYNNLQASFLG